MSIGIGIRTAGSGTNLFVEPAGTYTVSRAGLLQPKYAVTVPVDLEMHSSQGLRAPKLAGGVAGGVAAVGATGASSRVISEASRLVSRVLSGGNYMEKQ